MHVLEKEKPKNQGNGALAYSHFGMISSLHIPYSRQDQQTRHMHTLIIGAGWAGLSAAVHLAKAGHTQITLLEAAPQAGGRGRSVPFGTELVDNGQHLLVGAYQHYLKLLSILDIPETQVLHRAPFHFHTQDVQTQTLSIQTALSFPNLPGPFHMLFGLLTAHGLTIQEKIQIVQLCRKIKKEALLPALLPYHGDISVRAFLTQHKQSENIIQSFWEPLVLAALTTPISKASTQIFLKVFQEVFAQKPTHSNWLYPKHDLSTLLPNPAIQYLRQKGHCVLFNQRIKTLFHQQNQCLGASSHDNTWHADNVILATSLKSAFQLMQPISGLSPICHRLQKIHYQPITTLYLKVQEPILYPRPLVGFIKGTGHWVFNRALSGNPTILSVIISGEGPYQALAQETLVEKIMQEIQIYYSHQQPRLAPIQLVAYKVITEKQAAFSCDVGIETLRPSHHTPIHNLYLAGDYTQTGYPSTLEGAVLSGYKAAKDIDD